MHISRSKFLRLGLLALCSGLAIPLYSSVKAVNEFKSTVKASRLKTLSKGFNLEHWQGHELTDGFYTRATLLQYKSLGLTYTRLPVIWSKFLDDNNPSVLNTDYLAALDAIVQMHIKIGLGIIICPFSHPSELYSDSAVLAKFIAFSKAFATHLSNTNPEKVFLEVLNEPYAETPQDWNKIQLKLIPVIRSSAPNHTIVASSNLRVTNTHWNNVQALLKTQIVKDKNVVYNFHFYDPFVFTHQGATWGWNTLQFMKNVPYPSTPQAVASVVDEIRDSDAKWAVENYGKEKWNRAKLRSILSPVADWAKTNRVPVICNEFGAIPWTAPRGSRLRYLKDVRQIFESYGIGWAHWFGLDMSDKEAMQALGLKPLLRS